MVTNVSTLMESRFPEQYNNKANQLAS